MVSTYTEAVAQLFLHAALNNGEFADYLFKEILIQKLMKLEVDPERQFELYNETVKSRPKNFTLISDLTKPIPKENLYGIYCHCLQLGIVRLMDNPSDEFFLLLKVASNISFEEGARLNRIFSEMFLTFIFDPE